MQTQHSIRTRLAAIGCTLALAVGLGSFAWQRGATGQEADRPAPAPKAPQRQAEQLSQAFRHAAEVALPTVVTVRSRTKAEAPTRRGGRNGRPGGENPFRGTPFEDFFREFDGGEDMMPSPRGRREGMGSGVIVDKSGIVLTNNHVVEGADEVIVHLADGREFKAEDIKTDPQTDMAVLRIKGAGTLPAAPLGNSDSLEIGDWVLAIGNPFELEQTVSAGIISGKGRELDQIRRAQFLQTDAAINPGNSGGPLVNLDGEVVGINTAIATSSGSFAGIGFAIPSNTAKWVMNQLIKRGEVERAYLGVAISEINSELARQLEVERGQGVIVTEVYPKSPAAEAGVEVGDIITSVEGHQVKSPRDLQETIERAPIDSKQELSVLRNGRKQTVDVVARPLPREFGVATRPARVQRGQQAEDGYQAEELGIEVTDVTRAHLQALGLEDAAGVVITNVDPNSIAAEQGLREGMLISKIGKRNVTNVDEFKEAVEAESVEDGIMLLVRTRSGNRFVVLREE